MKIGKIEVIMVKIEVKGTEIRIVTIHEDDFISLTDMLKAKDGDFLYLIG
jgi:hypothetical protein